MNTIKLQLQAILLWLLNLTGYIPPRPYRIIPISEELHSLSLIAQTICDRLDHETTDTTGEYKRDKVYAQLHNTFPEFRPRDIYLAILIARSNLTDTPTDKLEVV